MLAEERFSLIMEQLDRKRTVPPRWSWCGP